MIKYIYNKKCLSRLSMGDILNVYCSDSGLPATQRDLPRGRNLHFICLGDYHDLAHWGLKIISPGIEYRYGFANHFSDKENQNKINIFNSFFEKHLKNVENLKCRWLWRDDAKEDKSVNSIVKFYSADYNNKFNLFLEQPPI